MAKKEKPETKICKHCKSVIPYGAKVCPLCRKRVKGGALKWILLGILAIIVIAAISGGKEDETSSSKKVGEVAQASQEASTQTVQSETQSEVREETGETAEAEASETSEVSEEAPVKTQYAVGDILQDGDMKIVYISSGYYTEDNEYSQPDEGMQYIFLQLSFENTSATADDSVSMYSFNCYADGYAAEMYYGGEEDLSASLSPGRTTSGYLYFTVPVDAKEIEVEYETNVFTSEKINFLFEGEKDSGYVVPANTTATAGAYQVGDIVESSELKITYLSCEEYVSDNMFIQPTEGNQFLTCEFEFENLGDSDEYVSAFDFDCYADGKDCAQCFARDDELSATLSAGRKTKGTVTFEVPISATVVEFEYVSNYWTSNRVVFTAK